jgi:hypothetical protein
MFFSQYFSFPRQYLSTNAPYSFIHLPPTLYNVFFSQYFRFTLLVSFHNAPYPSSHTFVTLLLHDLNFWQTPEITRARPMGGCYRQTP